MSKKKIGTYFLLRMDLNYSDGLSGRIFKDLTKPENSWFGFGYIVFGTLC